MKKISELYNIDCDNLVKDIKINSKEVTEGDIFVCVSGVNFDRHLFVPEAIKNGAGLIVAKNKIDADVPVVYVENPDKELISLAKKVYDYNEDSLDLIGITGTNGKTTTALMIKELMGDVCAYLGTNGKISKTINEKIRNTTPDADRLYKYFNEFVKDDAKYLAIEASSEAFFRHRLDTLKFKVGILTNITRDHINIHKTIENYIDCKMELLRNVKDDGYSILNVDDDNYSLALKEAKGTILTFGKDESTLQIVDIKEYINKTNITLKYNDKLYNFDSPYLGEVNVYNLCGALLALISYGYKLDDLILKVANMTVVKGRFEFLDFGQKYNIMIDYAHTLDAFMKIIPFLNKVKENRLVVITGAAGGREKEKRPLIGSYLLDNVDEVIFTTDDPRNESVSDIINDLKSESNNTNYKIIEDRSLAIKYAFDNANQGDIILLAGKGYDNYMAVKDEYLPYSEIEEVEKYFNNKTN